LNIREATSGPLTVVPARGVRPFPWLIRLVVLLLVPYGYFRLLYGPFGKAPPGGFEAWAIASVFVYVGVDLLLEELGYVRRVEITDFGVAFVFWFHTEKGRWDQLFPSDTPVWFHSFAIMRSRGEGRRPRAYNVTVEQAKAIIAHPCAANWKLTAVAAHSLGLAAFG
jgi:hypothetical protein